MAAITVRTCSCFQLALNHTTGTERPLNFMCFCLEMRGKGSRAKGESGKYCCLRYADNKEPFSNAGVKDE